MTLRPRKQIRPSEGDWECAHRILRHCHPFDQGAAVNRVFEYRRLVLAEVIRRLQLAYDSGNVAQLLEELKAE